MDSSVLTVRKTEAASWGLSGSTLWLIAAISMIVDHIGYLFFPGIIIFRIIGRIVFPIFAFLLVEGFHHSKDKASYAVRLFVLALVSEVPFDVFVSGKEFAPGSQNVIWTLLIGLLTMEGLERVGRGSSFMDCLNAAIIIAAGMFAAIIMLTDYHACGIMMILVFYYFREQNIKNAMLQIVFMLFICCVLMAGRTVSFRIFGLEQAVELQSFALYSLPLIWLYNGDRGYGSVAFRGVKYAFYPVHLALLNAVYAALQLEV